MRRFFTDRKKILVGSSVKLNQTEASHVRDTLRLRPDDEIILFNGEAEFVARLKLVSKDAVMAEVKEKKLITSALPLKICLFVGLIRPNRFETILEKCTEIGVAEITPIITEYTQIKPTVAEKKYPRWQKIIIEACKQSENNLIPQLNHTAPLADCLDAKGLNVVLSLKKDLPELDITKLLSQTDDTELGHQPKVNIFIGPEGGFSPQEEELFTEKKLHKLQLFNGENVLRTETAAIVASAIIKYLPYAQHSKPLHPESR